MVAFSTCCDLWFRSSGFLSVVSPGSKKSYGCVVLFPPPLSLVQSSTDEEGRLFQCEFSFHDQSFRVVSLYAPNRNPVRNQFLEQLADEVDPSIPTLLCGDFNTVFDRNLDRSGSDSSDTWRESSAALMTLFQSCCCIDAASLISGCSLCPLVILFPVPILIIVLCCFLFLSLALCRLVITPSSLFLLE